MSEIKKDESVESKTEVKAKKAEEEKTEAKAIKAKEKTTEEKKSTEKATTKKNINRKGVKVVKKSTKANSSPKLSPEEVKKQIEAKIDAFFEANKEFGIKKLVSASKLMEVGANIGTYAKYWNPKMKPFIYNTKNSKNCVIDLLKCMVFLDRAYNFLRDLTKERGRVLIVGTRGDIIKNTVKEEAKRVKSFYINQRWLGGTLTNFKTVNHSIIKLNNLIALNLSGDIKKYSKKEQILKMKEAEKLGKFLGGIRTMKGLPQAVIVIDPVAEHNAVTEARKLHIPVVALANTNADPSLIDFIIPCNTSSIKTVYLLLSVLCDAIAAATGEPQLVVGKKDDEIILPDIAKKVQNQNIIVGTKFTKSAVKAEGTEKATEVIEEAK